MCKAVYLESQARTQDVYNAKWAFRAAGCRVHSTWHDEPSSSPRDAQTRGSLWRLEQIRQSDSLVVMAGDAGNVSPELAFLVGFALAKGLELIWVGKPCDMLAQFRSVRHFANVEQLRKYLLNEQAPWQTQSPAELRVA